MTHLAEKIHAPHLSGILLAAGVGARFDPSGNKDKLMQTLDNGDMVAVAAARNLLAALPMVLAVVRPGANALAEQLRLAGCEVIACPNARQGMGASLAYGISHMRKAAGWLIALADMPYVQPATILALSNAIMDGADIAAPICRGRRGNPVAFGRVHLPALLNLGGDQGARNLLKSHRFNSIAVDDVGILRDIDTVDDIAA